MTAFTGIVPKGMTLRIVPLLAALGLLLAAVIACGGADPTAAPTATTAPTATMPPAPTAMPQPTAAPTATAPAPTTAAPTATRPAPAAPTPTPAEPPTAELRPLAAYADAVAGGPGAIFFGDPLQLVGPPPHEALMFQANAEQYQQAFLAGLFGVAELGIPDHLFIYNSEYYQGLLEKARLTDPTPLTSAGESVNIQHACINRTLPTCVLIQAYLAPNLAQRTNGQVNLEVTSFVELGIGGPDTLEQVTNGTLDMVNIYTGYVSGALPPIEVQSLWGMGPDWATTYLALTAMAPDIDRLLGEATDGGVVLNRNWFAGADQWFFTKEPMTSLEDFQGKTVRTHATALSDVIRGLGGEPVFIPPGADYLALERGQVDVGTTGALLAVSGKYHEIADYMMGPLIAFGYTNNVVNHDVWDGIPADLQQIIIEEGAKAELEALRLAPFQNIMAVQLNQALGVQPTLFTEEQVRYIAGVVVPEFVVPGWVQRLNYPEENHDAVRIFNEHGGPFIGLRIAEDGSVERAPITRGIHAGN